METQQGVSLPADYSFETVNAVIHNPFMTNEDIKALCLMMATHIDRLQRGEFICKKCGLRKDGVATDIPNF